LEQRPEFSVRSTVIDETFATGSPCEFQEWFSVLESDPQAGIFHHPYLVRQEALAARVRTRRDPLLLTGCQGGEAAAIAALLPKDLSARNLGARGFSHILRGYVVAGKRPLVAKSSSGRAKEWDPRADLRTLLCAAGAHLRASRASFLLLEDLEPAGPLWDALQELGRREFRVIAPHGFQERLRIRFPESPDAYWSQFSSKTRSTFRRKTRKIGAITFERITRADQVADFLEAAHAISRNSWQTERLGLRVHNDEVERRQLETLAEKGALRSYLLRKEGCPAAFLVGNQFRGYFNYEEVGYDRNLAQDSPGQVLLVQAIDDLLEHDSPAWLDFGGGDADYKRLFANHRSSSGNVLLVPRSLPLDGLFAYAALCRRTGAIARRIAGRMGLTTRFRQMIRRGRSSDGASAEASQRE
jgi:hypothetical protein